MWNVAAGAVADSRSVGPGELQGAAVASICTEMRNALTTVRTLRAGVWERPFRAADRTELGRKFTQTTKLKLRMGQETESRMGPRSENRTANRTETEIENVTG
ncbi:hypothetical protein EVAR_9253_1 [Eumeta japonica]|uniref:Uncharacterized protein n=1 Tax=Eumeta variegata TaxID=151549 RepID=A0A4C1TNS0_EUMVA|nr:hypothetical protein EVAR_9253_1 [Eumeta japonica]